MMIKPGVSYITDKFVPKQYAYDDRYIALLDILGFTQFIQTSIDNPDARQNINEALTSIYLSQPSKWLIDPDGKHITLPQSPDGIRTYIFSDHILVTAPVTPGGLNKLLNECWKLFGNLLYSCSVLLRGAIVKGKVYDDTQIIYGPGVIDALKNEKNIATYPRVILDFQVAKDYKHYLSSNSSSGIPVREYDPTFSKEIKLMLNTIPIREDSDGINFIDVLSCHPSWLEKYDPAKDKRSFLSHQTWLSFVKNFINTNLEIQKDEKIKMKYVWLKNYFNLALDRFPKYQIDKL
jgi:hypothetical protein